jgi:hypothetical protein
MTGQLSKNTIEWFKIGGIRRKRVYDLGAIEPGTSSHEHQNCRMVVPEGI